MPRFVRKQTRDKGGGRQEHWASVISSSSSKNVKICSWDFTREGREKGHLQKM